jgi:hypothetical protein
MENSPADRQNYYHVAKDFLGDCLLILPLVLLALAVVHSEPVPSQGGNKGLAIILVVVVFALGPAIGGVGLIGGLALLVWIFVRFRPAQSLGIIFSLLTYPVGDRILSNQKDADIIALASHEVRTPARDFEEIRFDLHDSRISSEYIVDLVLATRKESFEVKNNKTYRALTGQDCLQKPELIISMLQLILRGIGNTCIDQNALRSPGQRANSITISESGISEAAIRRFSRERGLHVVDVWQTRNENDVRLMRTLSAIVDGKLVYLPAGFVIETKRSSRHTYDVNFVVMTTNAALGFDPTEEVSKLASLDYGQAIKLIVPHLTHQNRVVRSVAVSVALSLAEKQAREFSSSIPKSTRSPSGFPEWELFQDQLLFLFQTVVNDPEWIQQNYGERFLAILEPSRKEPVLAKNEEVVAKKERSVVALVSEILRSDRAVDKAEIQDAISGIKSLRNVLPVEVVTLARTRINNLTAHAVDQEGILAVAYCAATHKNIMLARLIMDLPHMHDRIDDERWLGLTKGCLR